MTTDISNESTCVLDSSMEILRETHITFSVALLLGRGGRAPRVDLGSLNKSIAPSCARREDKMTKAISLESSCLLICNHDDSLIILSSRLLMCRGRSRELQSSELSCHHSSVRALVFISGRQKATLNNIHLDWKGTV